MVRSHLGSQGPGADRAIARVEKHIGRRRPVRFHTGNGAGSGSSHCVQVSFGSSVMWHLGAGLLCRF